jgi:hypothetical protein
MQFIKITPLRLQALQYAAGKNEYFPSYSVSRALQRAGLIYWDGWVKGIHHPSEKINNNSRGWIITTKGQKILDSA